MTAGQIPGTPCTLAEYLRLDRADEWKNEYLDGQIRSMPSASREHVLIMGNLGGELHGRLSDKPRNVFMARMRLQVSRTGLYTYPDVMVVCPPIQVEEYEDADDDTILNPVMIAEVLSPASEAYDRGEKFWHYRRLESLNEYLLVSQDQAWIEQYVRQGDQWRLSDVTGLDAVLSLESIGCAVKLSEIYHEVQLSQKV
jgi:Uma2 family endonuclease